MGHDTTERDNMWKIALALEKEYTRQHSPSRRLPHPLPPVNGLLGNAAQLHAPSSHAINEPIRLPPINFANLTTGPAQVNSPMASISPRTVSPRGGSAVLPSIEHDSPSAAPSIPRPPNPTADSISSTHSTAVSLISASNPALPVRSAHSRTSSSTSSSSTTTTVTPETHSHLRRQLAFFTGLEHACIGAAGTYWRSQCDSAFAKPRLSSPQLPSIREPRDRPLQLAQHPAASTVLSHPAAAPPSASTTLATYLHAIADLQWRRASASGDAAAALEAVHRMGNLYAWGDRIVGAARGELGVADEALVAAVAVTARDLAGWLLSEEAKREIELLWEEWCCGVGREGGRRGGSGTRAGADDRNGVGNNGGSEMETEDESEAAQDGDGHAGN